METKRNSKTLRERIGSLMLAGSLAVMSPISPICLGPVRETASAVDSGAKNDGYIKTENTFVKYYDKYTELENIAITAVERLAEEDIKKDYDIKIEYPFNDECRFVTCTKKDKSEGPIRTSENPDGSDINMSFPHEFPTAASPGGVNKNRVTVERYFRYGIKEITIYAENTYGVRITLKENKAEKQYFLVDSNRKKLVVRDENSTPQEVERFCEAILKFFEKLN